MEVVKFQQAQQIKFHFNMYYARTDPAAFCHASSLIKELG